MRKVLPILFILALAGCMSTKVMHTSDATRAPTDPAKVQVFTEAPERSFSVIAIVKIQADDVVALDTLLAEMKKAAASEGGDGVLVSLGEKPTGGVVVGNNVVETSDTLLVGKVIVFDD